uniref:Histidine--tRNA ligase, chloroplastic n=1 Tax=Yamadaella caenomyce TaxID=259029 RepID=A0A1G4NYY1_9FLOR|nr:Histidine-tRNA ligase [Yamadaella caenomyce]SCW23893.1 Histidine-tRNA ligase [Yamadaella caenomyce]
MKSVRGMYDILPDTIHHWQYLYNAAFKILDRANYDEIRTPIVEVQSLFNRTIGENTDIVSKEMYNFSDRKGRMLTLRPEGTAGIARAIVEHKLYEKYGNQKLWYLGPMFRYERPQQGRQRQFHQLGLEHYGSKHAATDAEVISLAHKLLTDIGCNHLTLEVNSLGTREEKFIYINQLKDYLMRYKDDFDTRIQHLIKTNPIRILDSKDGNINTILQGIPKLELSLGRQSMQHFTEVQEYLVDLQVPFQINNKLVRGLDYYNNTVFEIKSRSLGSQDAICGGGRYDNLTQEIGGNQIPAIGWGMGLERLLIIFQEKQHCTKENIDLYITAQTKNEIRYTLKLLSTIQDNKLKYELDVSHLSLAKKLQKANKKGARICIIIGQEEVNQNTVTLKWLSTKTQTTYTLDSFFTLLPSINSKHTNIYKNVT